MKSNKEYRQRIGKIGSNLRKKFRREIKIANDTIILGRKVLQGGHYDASSSYKKVLMFLAVKTFKSLRALKVLCQRGYGQDAKILLRVMADCLITTAYIQTDKENLSTRFIEYSWVDKQKVLNGFRVDSSNSLPSNQPIGDKEKDIIQGTINFKNKYGYEKMPKNWSGLNINEMAEKAGEMPRNIYNWVFRFTSLTVHPSAAQADEYILGLIDDQNVSIEFGPSNQWVQAALVMGCIVELWLLGQFDEEFNLGYKNSIEKLMVRLNQKK